MTQQSRRLKQRCKYYKSTLIISFIFIFIFISSQDFSIEKELMENPGNFTSLPFIMIPLFLLCFLLSSSAYSPPDKFFINCGSNSNVTYGRRTFFGENSVAFTKQGSEAIDQSASATSPIYQTVRTFRRRSSYSFKLDSSGFYIVRLHFSAVSSRPELLASRFSVSVSAFGHPLLKNFSLQNSTENPHVEEFLLTIGSVAFEISFEPEKSSFALVNAIEVFPAPEDFIPDQTLSPSNKNLRTVYRLNVGGEKLTPDNDTLWRNWSPDDDFLYNKGTVRNVTPPYAGKPSYQGTLTEYTAPDYVYQTAKVMNFTRSEGVTVLMNVTWTFQVKKNANYFIRAHFCDIINPSLDPDFAFFLYVNGELGLEINPALKMMQTAAPFYNDSVVVSDGSGMLNVSIRNKGDSYGFLNGLQVMEILGLSGSSGSSTPRSSGKRVYVIAGSVAGGSVLILILLFLLFLKLKKSKKPVVEAASVWSPLPGYRGGTGSSHFRVLDGVNNSPLLNLNLGLKIAFAEILTATNNFDERFLVGKGGFGNVYKGVLRDGRKVAIKRAQEGSGQGLLEFQTEIQVLSKIRHRHLVSLTGYCDENSEMILVYEFMEKGTLKEHLYGSNLPSLTWKQRLEICIGAARGLHYLHSGATGAIIHRDVKSTNILLDENLVAKVADFGLSKLTLPDQIQTHFSSNIKGTFGYLDPEYFQTNILTEKSDVYSFGVVLLEVLCARPAIDRSLPHEEVNLGDWGMFCKSKGKVEELVDPTLRGQIEQNSLRKFLEVAEKCLKDNSGERTSMADVVWDLEYALQLQRLTVHREPHEDSGATGTGSGGGVAALQLLSVSESFSSFVQRQSLDDSRGGGTVLSDSQVFSQLNISEAR
ncbi:PREDICTED: probable receptor-like protein kinase At2g23200 isoform X1 [Tarenaya hassleriana]|uniref:probable receptor-like protein kinase At2g23200 isoform X1 n=1 Tax=Tarenaya hassleriana TaxID=28532 RepID=UPI00053C9413|nr:PREDICTED: probable receptor-like protein kinase At2g23200 isoform X1 [Tarenaya hassleriana]